jgi:hypothetical protein
MIIMVINYIAWGEFIAIICAESALIYKRFDDSLDLLILAQK